MIPMLLAADDWGFWAFLQNKYAISGLVSVTILLVAILIWRILGRQASKDVKDENTAHRIRRNVLSMTMLLTVIVIAAVWSVHVDLALSAGLIGAGIALAMQNVLLSLGGWFALALRRIYDVGDRIEISGTLGDVLDIGLLHTTLLEVANSEDAQQSTGRIVTIPNNAIFIGHVFNFTKGFPFVWNDLRVTITFESDWREAKKLMLELAQRSADEIRGQVLEFLRDMRRKLPIRFEHLTPIVYTKIADSGVELALRYLSAVRQRRGVRSDLSERILAAFAASDRIELAYPTARRINYRGKDLVWSDTPPGQPTDSPPPTGETKP